MIFEQYSLGNISELDSTIVVTPDELHLIDEELFNDNNFDLTAIVFKSNVE